MEHFLFYLACGAAMLIGPFGCVHHERHHEEIDIFLSKAASAAARGDFEQAFDANETVLRRYFEIVGDKALYQRALFHIHPENPNPNQAEAVTYFRELKKRFPGSALSAESDIWVLMLDGIEQKNAIIRRLETDAFNTEGTAKRLSQRNKTLKARIDAQNAEIRALENQIEKLKTVDLGIEQKKREAVERQ